ncbi:hypothetical protein SRS16CHR_00239 [Variovorax sp. SRS16]|nr:hypothetical protein SRS16CHR_00239 [Variovorax sp. SRS16]
MAAGGARGGAQARALVGRGEVPALGAVPFEEGRSLEVDGGRGLGHREAPEAVRAGDAEPGQALVACGLPVGLGLCIGLTLAAQVPAGGIDRGHGAAQAQPEAAGGVLFAPAAGVEGQRLGAPAVEQAQGIGLGAFEAQGGLGGGDGQDLEADFGDEAERAQGAGEQARDVVAGDVLHDLAAEGEHFAAAVDEGGAQHVVAHGARAGARGAAEAGGDHAADGAGARGAEARGLEGQALATGSEGGFEFGQGRAGARGDDEFAGFVAGDAGEGAGGKELALRGFAVEVLGAGAADAKPMSIGGGGADAIGERGEGRVHGRHRSAHDGPQSSKKWTGSPGVSTRIDTT